MNWPTSSLTGHLLDEIRENPKPCKCESRQRPDCTIKLLTDKIVFDAVMNWTTSSLTGNLLDDTRENPTPYQCESRQGPDWTIKLFADDIVFDALRWWIDQHRHWRVICLMIPESTLYHTNANHDRDQIVRQSFWLTILFSMCCGDELNNIGIDG